MLPGSARQVGDHLGHRERVPVNLEGPVDSALVGAGGLASTGYGPILDVPPEKLHQRVPLFIGSANMVRRAEAFLRGDGPGDLPEAGGDGVA